MPRAYTNSGWVSTFGAGALLGFILGLVVLIIIMGEQANTHMRNTCDHFLWNHADTPADSVYFLTNLPECENYKISKW